MTRVRAPMARVRALARKQALSLTLLLVAVAIAFCTYNLIEIGHQRAATILRECNAQNARHADTVTELDRVLKRAEANASPARLRQLKESRASTLLLIDALAPYRDCQRFVKRAT